MINRTISLYKTSFSGLSKETWILSFIMLINRSGTMVVPFMTLYLTSKSMGRTLSEAGFVLGLFGLGSVIGAYFGGKFSDKIGFYKIQLFTLFFWRHFIYCVGPTKVLPFNLLFHFFIKLSKRSF